MNGLAQWIVTSGTKGAIRDAEKDGKVEALVKSANDLITAFYPDDPKAVKQMIVQHLVFPFAKSLLKDNPAGLLEAKRVSGI